MLLRAGVGDGGEWMFGFGSRGLDWRSEVGFEGGSALLIMCLMETEEVERKSPESETLQHVD